MNIDRNQKFDVVLISYNESNSDKNWLHLKGLVAGAKRVHGVDGILKAHQEAAKLSDTEFLFIIDGDNYVLPNFKFLAPVDVLDPAAVYVWRARNPVNDLVYGYGGVKLYPKALLLSQEGTSFLSNGDIATNISRNYIVVDEVASETRFNASPLEAWRGSFREATKLALNLKEGKGDPRTENRLKVWMSCGRERPFGEWAIAGAREGYQFAQDVLLGKDSVSRINKFEWLNKKFLGTKGESPENVYREGARIIQSVETIYGPQSYTTALNELIRRLSNENEDQNLDFELFQCIESFSNFPSIDAVRNLKLHPKNFISQMDFADAFSEKPLFRLLKELRKSLLLSDHPWNLSSKSIRLATHFPEGIREDLALLIKEDFSENILFKIYDQLSRVKGYEHLKVILDLRNPKASEKENRKVVLNFLDSLYNNKNIKDLRVLLDDRSQAVPALTRIINNLNSTWLTHGIRRLAHEGWLKDFQNSLSLGQLKSKLWLIDKLESFVGKNENCAVMGGWAGILPALLFEKMPNNFQYILSLDKSAPCEAVANQLNVKARMDGGRFWAITRDMHNFQVDAPQLDFWPNIKFNWVINTSCEHIDRFNEWIESVPKGTKLALQSNNFFDHKEHINCASSLEEFLLQASLGTVYYSGELKLPNYNRFMIIGEK